MKKKAKIWLNHNGDPYGRGFTGYEAADDGRTFYRGDLGAQTRAWWRAYARANGYELGEVRPFKKARRA